MLFDPVHSVRYESSEQLVALGVMRDASARVAVTRDTVPMPPIPPIREQDRPFWSVVTFTDDAVDRVLEALDGGPPSELVVVSTPQHLTDVEMANVGLRQSRGSWIHVLGRDTPSPCFYEAMAAAVAAPGVALAVAHPLPLDFAVRSSSFVAARHLYEQAGGFCATIPFAAAWEIVQRLAHTAGGSPVSVPVPAPEGAGSPAFAGYGEEVVHWLAAIDLVRDIAGIDIAALHDRCAARAADLVGDDVERGRFASALATVTEALRVPITADGREFLTTALARTLR